MLTVTGSLEWLVIWPTCQLQMYSDASKVIPMIIKSFQHFPMLSNVYVQMLMTHMTSKMCTYTSQSILTLSSTYTLKSWQFPPICDDPQSLCTSHKPLTLSMSLTCLLHSNISKPGDLSLSPTQPSVPCSVLFDMLYSCPRLLFKIIPFPLPCSLPFHCKV
jgi:hypothetical protein